MSSPPHPAGPCFWGCQECPEEDRRRRAFFVEHGGRPLNDVRLELEAVERVLGRKLNPETYERDLEEFQRLSGEQPRT